MTPGPPADRPTSTRFDRVADRYDETRGGLERGARLAAGVATHLLPGQPVLEVGVGTGAVALGLANAGWPVVGVDLSHPMLRRARQRLGAHVAVADAEMLPIRGDTLRNVVMVWVLHLVADVLSVLRETARVARPGARVAIVPGRPSYRHDDIGEVMTRLEPVLAARSDATEHLIDLGHAAELEPVHVGDCGLAEFEQSPEELATGLERRDFSWLWDVDAHTWRTLVQPVIDGLRALPDPERPRRRASRHTLLVLERR